MKKKMIALLSSVLIVLTCMMPILAEEPEIKPHAEQCGACGSMSLHSSVIMELEEISAVTRVKCVHGTGGYDLRTPIYQTVEYKCFNCGYSTLITQFAYYKYDCQGK